MSLTTEQVAEYRERGFLILDGLLSEAARERAMGVFRQLVAQSRERREPDGHLAPCGRRRGAARPGAAAQDFRASP